MNTEHKMCIVNEEKIALPTKIHLQFFFFMLKKLLDNVGLQNIL